MKKFTLFLLCFSAFCLSCQETTEFHHVLLYRWADDVEGPKKEKFLEIFKGLPSKIEGLNNVSLDLITNSSEDHDILITLHFSSDDNIKTYQNHPDHKTIELMAADIIQDYDFFQFTK
ncbi:Dabb family protein [Flagellimonas myxillae]|uniref:Dabb family protein n=1 Tax=Flagellimonas myxillae TaxID=2942214 RepID=UPI00201F4648|nr:Dabb family protein [Muricauda myxillae]MCL6266149.1 Dabb family protein [Muricauda myxillae]